jgi:hypothetical protein
MTGMQDCTCDSWQQQQLVVLLPIAVQSNQPHHLQQQKQLQASARVPLRLAPLMLSQ